MAAFVGLAVDFFDDDFGVAVFNHDGGGAGHGADKKYQKDRCDEGLA